MNYQTKSILFWILSFILMASLAIFQRMTGPTYPVKGTIDIDGQNISYKLLRSSESGAPAINLFDTEGNNEIIGSYSYRRLNSPDDWTEKKMQMIDGKLEMQIPSQPAAGKVAYKIELTKGGRTYQLTEKAVVIRFKGAVPASVLIPHIFFMFFAMMFSLRTGIEALIRGKRILSYTFITTLLLLVGGLILGPIVQKYAFDAYWTGWPMGKDLTDNKLLFGFIMWAVASFKAYQNPKHRGWVIAASIALLLVYLIPHSMFGSELDYESGQVITGNK